jgi:putative phage-type endonuclease
MVVIMEQRTEEWYKSKLGNVGASRVADVIAKTKSGYSTSRRNYMMELILQRLTGKQADSFFSADMQRGIDLEPVAISVYEMQKDVSVKPVGFIMHSKIERSGASPDGLINDDGQIEVKCPKPYNHLQTLLGNNPPNQYIPQIQWQLACTGRDWCDFISYSPDFDLNMQIKIIRVPKDNEYILMLENEISLFVDEMILLEKEIKEKYYG